MKSAEASKTRTRVSFPGHEVKDSPASLFTPPVTLRRNIGGVAELSLNASGAPVFALMNGGGGGADMQRAHFSSRLHKD